MNAFDVIIIGFGKGGKTLAAEFAKRGQKVAIIERSDKMYGGTCINIGCIPTKTLVHQAKMASALKDATFEERSEECCLCEGVRDKCIAKQELP